jgi:hypothetical protein
MVLKLCGSRLGALRDGGLVWHTVDIHTNSVKFFWYSLSDVPPVVSNYTAAIVKKKENGTQESRWGLGSILIT